MPYVPKKENGVLKEQRAALEPYLELLLKAMKTLAGEYRKFPEGGVPIYRYVIEKLAFETMPERRYTALSNIRAVFNDMLDEWCYKMNVRPEENLVFLDSVFNVLDREIVILAHKIRRLANESGRFDTAWQGLLNYSGTTMGLKIMDDPYDKHFAKLIAGTIKYVYSRFYKVFMRPYEDEKEAENGSVYPKRRE